jgi:AbrB family looped-hinge helix DNA binding protein
LEKEYIVKVDEKGRIDIPKGIRNKMNIREKAKIVDK